MGGTKYMYRKKSNNVEIDTKIKLEKFYFGSVEYKESLEKHDDEYFIKYIELIKMIQKTGTIFLDVGCGTGYSTKKISELEGVKLAVGSDISELFIEKKYEHSNLKFIVGDIHDISTKTKLLELTNDTKFDAIGFCDVIEHLYDLDLVFQTCHELLKPDGYLIICSPSIYHTVYPILNGITGNKKKMPKHHKLNSRTGTVLLGMKNMIKLTIELIQNNHEIKYHTPDLESGIGGDFDSVNNINNLNIQQALNKSGFKIISDYHNFKKMSFLKKIIYIGSDIRLICKKIES
jgi:SAM-dependent methyltransferase